MGKRLVLFFVVILLCVLGLRGWAQEVKHETPPEVAEGLKKAAQQAGNNNFGQAVDTLQGVMKDYPREVAPYRMAGLYAEMGGELEQALGFFERVLDTAGGTPEDRKEIRAHLARVQALVPPNTDPAKANVWRVFVGYVKRMDVERTGTFTETDEKGEKKKVEKKLHTVIEVPDEKIDYWKEAMRGFAIQVFRHTRGNLLIAYDEVVFEKPLTTVSYYNEEKTAFWCGPWDIMPLLKEVTDPSQYDTVFIYTMGGGDKDNPLGPAILGGTFGGDLGPGGAGYSAYMMMPDWIKPNPTGELEIHEWLHQIDWCAVACIGYPNDIVPSSDSGRMDPKQFDPEKLEHDYLSHPGESWMGFYDHIMRLHITSKMWHEMRMHATPPGYIHDWRLSEVFPAVADPATALGKAYIEEKFDHFAFAENWKPYHADGSVIDLSQAVGEQTNSVIYAAAKFTVPHDVSAKVLIGSDDGCVVYLDGKEISRAEVLRGLGLPNETVPVQLSAGEHIIVIKVQQTGGGWSFAVRLVDEADFGLQEVAVQP